MTLSQGGNPFSSSQPSSKWILLCVSPKGVNQFAIEIGGTEHNHPRNTQFASMVAQFVILLG
jgi:hypothetical protein